jgi:hypothetical protein
MKIVGEKARPERRCLRMGIQTLRITCEAASIRRCQRKEHCACAMSAFISCSFSSLRPVHSLCGSHHLQWSFPRGSGSPIPATVTGWAGLDFQRCCRNCKDGDVLPGKRRTGCNAGSNVVFSSYSCCVLPDGAEWRLLRRTRGFRLCMFMKT